MDTTKLAMLLTASMATGYGINEVDFLSEAKAAFEKTVPFSSEVTLNATDSNTWMTFMHAKMSPQMSTDTGIDASKITKAQFLRNKNFYPYQLAYEITEDNFIKLKLNYMVPSSVIPNSDPAE